MNDGAYGHRDEDDRRAWRQAAKRGRRQLVELHEQWVLPPESWYRDNSRATLRDETWPEWRQRATCRGCRPTQPGSTVEVALSGMS